MKCRKCGTENAPIKKCCTHCGAILEGFTVNNVTGEKGYRGSDGLFYRVETEEEAIRRMEQRKKELEQKRAAMSIEADILKRKIVLLLQEFEVKHQVLIVPEITSETSCEDDGGTIRCTIERKVHLWTDPWHYEEY